MASPYRTPASPVVDAQRSSRWPVIAALVIGLGAIGGGVGYDYYVAHTPIVLTPTRPEPSTRPGQPSSQPTRPSPSSRPTQTTSGMPEWMPAVFVAIPVIFLGIIGFVIFSIVRRVRRAAIGQMGGSNPISGGPMGHWSGGQHVGTGGAPAGAGSGGPWARAPGTATSGGRRADQVQPARKGFSFPILPLIVGAIILDQAVFNGRYSREAIAWATQFMNTFAR